MYVGFLSQDCDAVPKASRTDLAKSKFARAKYCRWIIVSGSSDQNTLWLLSPMQRPIPMPMQRSKPMWEWFSECCQCSDSNPHERWNCIWSNSKTNKKKTDRGLLINRIKSKTLKALQICWTWKASTRAAWKDFIFRSCFRSKRAFTDTRHATKLFRTLFVSFYCSLITRKSAKSTFTYILIVAVLSRFGKRALRIKAMLHRN